MMLYIAIFIVGACLSQSYAAASVQLDVYDEEACGEDRPRYIHVDTEGLIASPNFNLSHGDTYPPNSHCEWIINQTGSEGLEVKFLNMSLEESEQCKSDYVQVLRRGGSEDELLATYCGDQIPEAIELQSPVTLLVRFVSDATVEYAGFVARYGFPIDDRECVNSLRVQQINATSGMIYSPNWPQDYDDLTTCRWLFTAQENHTWIFNFTAFELESCCNCDLLEVHDGDSGSAPRFGAWFGENTSPPTIRSTGQHLYMRLITDNSLNYQGFLAFFAQIEETTEEEWLIM